MLILTRKFGETIIIANNIKITILGVKGNQVRLGIDAPKDISVHREEIYNRIQESSHKEEEDDNNNNNTDDNDQDKQKLVSCFTQ